MCMQFDTQEPELLEYLWTRLAVIKPNQSNQSILYKKNSSIYSIFSDSYLIINYLYLIYKLRFLLAPRDGNYCWRDRWSALVKHL